MTLVLPHTIRIYSQLLLRKVEEMVSFQLFYFFESLPNYELSWTLFISENFNFLWWIFRCWTGFELGFLEVEICDFIFEVTFIIFDRVWHLENSHQLLVSWVLELSAATHLSVWGKALPATHKCILLDRLPLSLVAPLERSLFKVIHLIFQVVIAFLDWYTFGDLSSDCWNLHRWHVTIFICEIDCFFRKEFNVLFADFFIIEALVIKTLGFLCYFVIHFFKFLHTTPLLFDPLLIFLEVPNNLDTFTYTENLFHKRSQKYRATDFNLVFFLGSILILLPEISKSLSK